MEQRLADGRPDHPGVRRRAARLPPAPGSPATTPPPRRCSRGSAGSRTWPRPPAGPPACKGDLDHFAALGFLQGLLTVLRDCGHPGLLLVLDEIETLQRVRGDVREKALNALRQLIDEIDAGRFPGLYLVITGTPAFFDGQQGVQRLPPLAQRLATDFATDPRFDHPRAVQMRLPGFDLDRARRARPRVRELYAGRRGRPERDHEPSSTTPTSTSWPRPSPASSAGRSASPRGCSCASWSPTCSTGSTQFADFDPRRHYALTAGRSRADRRRAQRRRPPVRADDIELDLP